MANLFTIFLILFCALNIHTTFSNPNIVLDHDAAQSDRPRSVVVHVARSQKPSLFTSHRHWYASMLTSFPSSKLLYSYEKAMHGFSASLTASQAESLKAAPGVLSVIQDEARQLHTTHTYSFLGLSDASGVWPNSDYADDIIIGVIDTGIWPERRSFADQGLAPVPSEWKGACETGSDFPASSCNRKLIGARSFNFAYLASVGEPLDASVESNSPRDTQGHGTHVASTAAGSVVSNASFYEYAQGQARGVATKARIAAYKVCWTRGCYDGDILAAMDRAILDGVHIISLSVGGTSRASQYYRDNIAIGAFGAIQHGVLVSCSAGNSGPTTYSASNLAPWILTVSASSVDRDFPADVVIGDGRTFAGASIYSGEPLPDGQFPLVYAGGDLGNKYCAVGAFDPTQVKGKIVVCDRGSVGRVDKGYAVKQAGGLGMIMANTQDRGLELVADAHLLPGTVVTQTDGDEIKKYIKSAKKSATATIVFRGTVILPSIPAPKVASLSSRGPNSITPQILKPDVVAPGLNILAAWTGATSPTSLDVDPRRVEFNIISGTCMACPHVSGIAALLKQANPSWSPAAIKSAIMTTAYTVDNSGKNITDLATGKESTPFAHGAGHVDPNRAVDPGLVYNLTVNDYVGFLCSIGYSSSMIQTIVREDVGSDVCTTRLRPGDLNYPSFSVVFYYESDSATYGRTLTNVGAEAEAVYEVSWGEPAGITIDVTPKTMAFSAENRTLSYQVKFTSSRGYGRLQRFSWIEWGEVGGTHRVRSPVAFRWDSGYVASM